MVALVIVLAVVVALLAILVAGLLRSHADILKALHDLGSGVGDPVRVHDHAAFPVSGPITIGPALPSERNSTSAPTVVGVTPAGDALALAPTSGDGLTLLAFLSSGCATCAGFWEAFRQRDRLGLPERTRLVVVTKGPEMEMPAEVRAKAPPGLEVVMSTDAWGEYEVPGSPFFVLVDAGTGRRIGEGVANHFDQVAELVRRAQIDVRGFDLQTRDARSGDGETRDDGSPGVGGRGGSRSRAHADGFDGPERELANDGELRAAGIEPGHPSLYPSSLSDVFAPGSSASDQSAAEHAAAAKRSR